MKKTFAIFMAFLLSCGLFAQGNYSKNDIGKIVLKDGSLITLEKFKVSKLNLEPIAIVWNVSEDGSYFYGMGLETEEMPFSTVKYYECDSGLEGLINGDKALDIIKKTYPKTAADLKTNFPAFYYASVYGEKNNLGKYSEGWFIPAEKEWGTDTVTHVQGDWELGYKAMENWKYFNEAFDHFPSCVWCSNARIYYNDYDDIYEAWESDSAPHNTYFSTNFNAMINSERGGFRQDSNSNLAYVIVLRKFN